MSERSAADLNVRRWAVRTIGYAVLMIAGCAWMVRGEAPFWPAFALQTLAGFLFTALILFSVWLAVLAGSAAGRIAGWLGWIVGPVVGIAFFFFAGIALSAAPVIGPPIERIVALIE